MKRFMETNTITHNLMSFSGFKALLIFSMLVESPKTYDEIREAIETNEYLKESSSIDTIRIYMNTLKQVGCNIQKIHQGRTVKYFIDAHPFELKVSDAQVKSILKVYKAISKSIEISDYLALKELFDKLLPYISNDSLKDKLQNISPIGHINSELINNLMKYCKNNTEITILYNAKNSGKRKEIDIIADKMNIYNGKLYLCGYNSEYKNYGEFLVSNIIKIISVNLESPKLSSPELTVCYEYYKDKNEKFEIRPDEKIIEEKENCLVVEITSRDKFTIIQRVLSFANKCKVISPSSYREEIISLLKKMKEGYIEEK